jgi:hypothetical protein
MSRFQPIGKIDDPKPSRISKPNPKALGFDLIFMPQTQHKHFFSKKTKKNTESTVESIMFSLHPIPDLKQWVPFILTYASGNRRDSFVDKPSLVSIGPPNTRKGDIIAQFIDCDVAVVIRSIEPSPDSTYDDDGGGTFAKTS